MMKHHEKGLVTFFTKAIQMLEYSTCFDLVGTKEKKEIGRPS